MSNLIQIKRSTSTAAPTSLSAGELAYSNSSQVIYIGSTDAGATIVPIGGVRRPGVLTANQALVANTTSGIDQVITTQLTLSANATAPGALSANGGTGTSGFVLFSGGPTTNAYWGSVSGLSVNSAAQYSWTNTHSFSGNVSFSSNVAVSGNAVFTGPNVYIQSTNTTIANVTFAGTNTVFTSNTTVGGTNAYATANTTLAGTNTVISSNVSLTGANLYVTGTNAYFTSNTTLAGTNTVISSNTTVGGTLATVTANATFSGANVSVTGTNAYFTSNTTLAGTNTVISSNVSLSGANVYVTGTNTYFGSNVAFNANSAFGGALHSVTSTNTNITSNTTLAGTNTVVSSNVSLTGANLYVTGTNAYFLSNTTVAGTNTVVTSNTTLSGANVYITSGNVAITGNTTIGGTNTVVTSNTLFTGSVAVQGNLTVTGTLTTIDTINLQVKDNFILTADQNNLATTDIVDFGIVGVANSAAGNMYYGLGRIASSNVFQMFNTATAPGLGTITGQTTMPLQAYLLPYGAGGAFVVNAQSVAITANNTVNVNITANSITLNTPLAATSGGTGLNTYTAGDMVYSSATNVLAKLAIGTSGYVLQVNSSNRPEWNTLDGGTF